MPRRRGAKTQALRATPPLFLVLYFLSGAAGLFYQVAWSRLLTLHMGHTLAAVSTVLAAFMGGLAAGAALAGRWTPHLTARSAARMYASLELVVAAAALLMAPALDAMGPVLTRAYADGEGGVWFGFMRAATSLLLVSVPAAVMGATFPAAVRLYAGAGDDAAPRAGVLYAMNTLGAASGAAVTGFVLIPALGVTRTTLAGVVLNVAIAAAAFPLARNAPGAEPPMGAGPSAAAASGQGRRQRPIHPAPLPLVAAALAVSGFVALVLEVVSTRTLALALGPTTHAFSLMLSIFIAGLGAGAMLGARLGRRHARPLAALGVALLAAAAGVILMIALGDRVPLAVGSLIADRSASYARVLAAEAWLAAALLLPAAASVGAAFPLAVSAVAAGDGRISRDASVIYAANTAGAIAGSLVAGFVLVPSLGLQRTALLAATLAGLAGLAVLLTARPSRATGIAGAIGTAAALATGWSLPAWNVSIMSGGAYTYARHAGGDLQAGLEAGRLAFYKEGASGTVSVRVVAGATSLAIDGKVDASDAGDMLTQALLAHVPLLLHPDPRSVAIIGLGSGVTLGSALRHPIERADTLEISQEVVEASAWFAHVNGRPLDDPRSRLIVGDGRTHLLRGTRRYDVIISEPSNPWMAGLAALFTRDFFLAARARLAPGGLFCQWAHTYDISDADLRSIVATFAAVFPDGAVWLVGESDILLTGGTQAVDPWPAHVMRAWERPGVAADLARVGVRDQFSLLSMVAGTGQLLQTYGAGAAIQTDDHMPLEFSAPRHALARGPVERPRLVDVADLLRRPPTIAARIAAATGAEWRNRGLMLLRASAYRMAYEAFSRAIERDPRDEQASEGLVRAAVPAGQVDDALLRLRRVIARDSANVTARIEASRLLASRGQIEEASRMVVDPGVAPTPRERARMLAQAASVFADAGDAARLEPIVRALEREHPDEGITLFYAATERYLAGQAEEALRLTELAVSRLPEARVHNMRGVALATLGRFDAARQAFNTAADADPRDVATRVNLGLLELERGNPRAAAAQFAEALAVDPGSEAARAGLASALDALGEHSRAARLRRQ